MKENEKEQKKRLGETVLYGFEIQVHTFHLIMFQQVVSIAFQVINVTDVISVSSVDAYGF